MANCSDGDHKKELDHIKRTASTPRLRSFRPLIVSDVTDLSETVKGITFRASKHYLDDLNFKAGQWVDMIIPGIETIGGFSICNSPSDLIRNKRMVLAVKYSKHPPAYWCNTKCKVGDRVEVRIGGNCYYECPDDPRKQRPLLLIGGGVGINPLLSIFLYRRDMSISKWIEPVRTHLVLAARNKKELLFEKEISEVCKSNPHFTCQFHVTKENLQPSEGKNVSYCSRRFTVDDLKAIIEKLTQNSKAPVCYICGPPPFIEWCAEQCSKAGLDKNLIRYEKWW